MPEDLKLSQIGSSQLPPPFRGLHSPGVRKYCQIIFACYFQKSSIFVYVRFVLAYTKKRSLAWNGVYLSGPLPSGWFHRMELPLMNNVLLSQIGEQG